MKFNDYMTKMMVYVRNEDQDHLDEEEKKACLASAVSDHTRFKPNTLFHDMVGTGEYDYDLPGDWIPRFSEVLSIEHPAGQRNRSIVPVDEYEVVWNGVKWQLRFLASEPATDEAIRIEYTTIHRLDHETDTIDEVDFDAFCMLAASHCCASLAAKFASTSDPSLEADVIDYRTKRYEYEALERNLQKKYFKAMGIDPDETGPTAGLSIGEMDPKFARRVDYLTHPRRWR